MTGLGGDAKRWGQVVPFVMAHLLPMPTSCSHHRKFFFKKKAKTNKQSQQTNALSGWGEVKNTFEMYKF